MLAVLSQNGWLLAVAFVLLAIVGYLHWRAKHHVPPKGEPLGAKTVVGMAHGKPEAWQEFRRLLKQPDPPDPREPIREIVREVLDERKRPATGG